MIMMLFMFLLMHRLRLIFLSSTIWCFSFNSSDCSLLGFGFFSSLKLFIFTFNSIYCLCSDSCCFLLFFIKFLCLLGAFFNELLFFFIVTVIRFGGLQCFLSLFLGFFCGFNITLLKGLLNFLFCYGFDDGFLLGLGGLSLAVLLGFSFELSLFLFLLFNLSFYHFFCMVVSLSIVDVFVVNMGCYSCVSVSILDIVIVCRIEFISSVYVLVVTNSKFIGFIWGFCNIAFIVSISSVVLIVVVNSMNIVLVMFIILFRFLYKGLFFLVQA